MDTEAQHDPTEKLHREALISLTRASVAKAYEQNPNALGFIIHGSRANEGIKGEKQPRENSDLDVITIRRNGDDKAPDQLANALWENIGPKYTVLVDTGQWGSLEWEKVLKANNLPADREKFRQEWEHLGKTPVIIGVNPEVEATIKKALLE